MNKRGLLGTFLATIGASLGKREVNIETNPEAVELEIARVKRELKQREKFPSRKQRLRLGLSLLPSLPNVGRKNYRALYRKLARINAKARAVK